MKEQQREQQELFMDQVARLIRERYATPPRACFVTYGCQQNVSDSERMKGMLCRMGYELTEKTDQADFILFNTCAVREHAEARVYGNLGATKRLKKEDPHRIIAICGCMAQQVSVAQRIRTSYPYVDILFGTQEQYRLPEFLYRRMTGSPRIFETGENREIVEGLPVHRDGSLKGWLPVMYGCNNFCTYCIVPHVRGRERSRDPREILREAQEMVSSGFREITLLGQNVNSYGKGESFGVNFPQLLRKINAIPGDFRIRFMTSHPKDCTPELLDAMRDCEKVCHHLHLPFQSGSDRILKAMNRRYDRKTYLSLVSEARNRMPDLSLTSDIIVGFPGETYEDFQQTLDLIRQVEFDSLFTFIYSPRNGTPAAEMPDPVSREEKGRWFDELLRTQEEIAHRKNQREPGKVYRVLCDDFGRREGTMAGHNEQNCLIEFPGGQELLGKFVFVRVCEATNPLFGEIIKS